MVVVVVVATAVGGGTWVIGDLSEGVVIFFCVGTRYEREWHEVFEKSFQSDRKKLRARCCLGPLFCAIALSHFESVHKKGLLKSNINFVRALRK